MKDLLAKIDNTLNVVELLTNEVGFYSFSCALWKQQEEITGMVMVKLNNFYVNGIRRKMMSNFEVVFKTCLESMHEVNEQKMGKMLADMMQLGFVEMKPVFEIFYNQGVEDGKGEK